MNDSKLTTLDQIQAFLAGTSEVAFAAREGHATRYGFIREVLWRFGYARLGRAHRGLILRYLARATGYSRQQLTRLVGQFVERGQIAPRYRAPRTVFTRRYTQADVLLLAEVDTLHSTLSGPATRVLLERALRVYADARFERLAGISVAHLYNLRKQAAYQKTRRYWTKTRPTPVAIGVRRPPHPNGQPGFIRIDSVHQGDQDGIKGLYHINAVDCVTQWELVATCERISEAFLLPVLETLLDGFPFPILGFHADNGSEYINKTVAASLGKLQVEFTKSRPRHSNDNALVETKNGAVVRKHLGYSHIPQRFAAEVNAFCTEYLNPYLNFHRPCFFAVEDVDAKGKIRKRYLKENILTPFEKLKSVLEELKSLPHAPTYLKPGITIKSLEQTSQKMSDNDAAKQLNTARTQLFQSIYRRSKSAA